MTKGYNLDFLDNLDDPNFNPFETKTGIKDNFASTETAASRPNVVKEDSPPCDVKECGKKTNGAFMCAPKPQKQEITAEKVENDLPLDSEESPAPVAKGYNMDFLDNLDDPYFNPFETKTGIKDNFALTEPAASQLNVVEEDSPPCDEEPKKEGVKTTKSGHKRFQ